VLTRWRRMTIIRQMEYPLNGARSENVPKKTESEEQYGNP
jgi:hypothetical protein